MSYKIKAFPFVPADPRLARLQQSCAAILLANWCFQGMRGMDTKELSFRLLLEALLAVLLVMALAPVAGVAAAVLPALAAAHSLQFLLNGQLWVCARYCPLYPGDAAALEAWTARLRSELAAMPWLEEAVLIGSRGGSAPPDPRSDIDLRLIFPPGVRCWLATNLLLVRLRSRALLAGLPLDLYAYDRPGSLLRHRQDEPLVIVLDRRGRLAARFADRLAGA
ncbi:hypothetical protein SH611_10735 [Geminicoccaceae bacterium 1502E]|nr:hypothetical protein [Geminicoccaceae bacterium 1502E]